MIYSRPAKDDDHYLEQGHQGRLWPSDSLNFGRLVDELAPLGVGFFEWGVADHTVWWSEGLYKIYGRAPSLGPPTEGLPYTHPDDVAMLEKAIGNAFVEGAYYVQYRIHPGDGSPERLVEARGRASFQRDGSPDRLFGVVLDITDRRRA